MQSSGMLCRFQGHTMHSVQPPFRKLPCISTLSQLARLQYPPMQMALLHMYPALVPPCVGNSASPCRKIVLSLILEICPCHECVQGTIRYRCHRVQSCFLYTQTASVYTGKNRSRGRELEVAKWSSTMFLLQNWVRGPYNKAWQPDSAHGSRN